LLVQLKFFSVMLFSIIPHHRPTENMLKKYFYVMDGKHRR